MVGEGVRAKTASKAIRVGVQASAVGLSLDLDGEEDSSLSDPPSSSSNVSLALGLSKPMSKGDLARVVAMVTEDLMAAGDILEARVGGEVGKYVGLRISLSVLLTGLADKIC